MSGVAEPGTGLEHADPLGGGEALLGGQLTGLLDAVGKIPGELPIEKHDRLGGVHAVLGAPQTEHIHASPPSEVGRWDTRGDNRVREACAIHLHRQTMLLRRGAKRANLSGGIDRAPLGGLCEREGPGLGMMHVGAFKHRALHQGGGQLAVRGRKGYDLGATGEQFGGATLVHVDMRVFMTEYPVITLAECRKGDRVGRRAVEDEEHFTVGLEKTGDQFQCAAGPVVLTVGWSVPGIGGGEGGQCLRGHPGGVVTGEGKILDDVGHAPWSIKAGARPRCFRVWQAPADPVACKGKMNAADVNLYLVGFMGTGKSTVARLAARRLGFRAIDSDHEIERQQNRSIAEIFAQEGEAAFRAMEVAFIEKGHPPERTIIACGGGLVVQPGVLERLCAKGVVICLHASFATVLERTQRNRDRPLLDVDNPMERIRALYAEREPIYKRAGTVILTDARPLTEVGSHVVRTWKREAADFVRDLDRSV